MTPEVYICDICWRDTISKSRICMRCRMNGNARLFGREDDKSEPRDDESPRSDSQYHGDGYE